MSSRPIRYLSPEQALWFVMTRSLRPDPVIPGTDIKIDKRDLPADTTGRLVQSARRLNKTTVQRQTTGGGRHVRLAATPTGHVDEDGQVHMKDWLGQVPEFVGWRRRPGRPAAPKAPSLSQRELTRRWRAKERPVGVSDRQWEACRLVKVERLSRAEAGRRVGVTGQRVGQWLKDIDS